MTETYGPCPRCGNTEIAHKMHDDVCAGCRLVRAHTSTQPVLAMELPMEPPTRLCCGQQHVGARCPDGLVMCCICFSRVPPEDLVVEDGQLVDVCLDCRSREKAHGS